MTTRTAPGQSGRMPGRVIKLAVLGVLGVLGGVLVVAWGIGKDAWRPDDGGMS